MNCQHETERQVGRIHGVPLFECPACGRLRFGAPGGDRTYVQTTHGVSHRACHRIDLWYPDPEDYVQVSLIHTRAADDIRISYDFDRDGWVVSMQKTAETEEYGSISWGEHTERAFVSAWFEVQMIPEELTAWEAEHVEESTKNNAPVGFLSDGGGT